MDCKQKAGIEWELTSMLHRIEILEKKIENADSNTPEMKLNKWQGLLDSVSDQLHGARLVLAKLGYYTDYNDDTNSYTIKPF